MPPSYGFDGCGSEIAFSAPAYSSRPEKSVNLFAAFSCCELGVLGSNAIALSEPVLQRR
jgi:hypothetical protein